VKALFITTTTNETCKHYESFLSLPGSEVELYVYRNGKPKGSREPFITGDALDSEIYAAAKAYAPHIIVYIGACGGNVPSIALFKRLATQIAPIVHFCSDASDDPWWPWLLEYEKARCFNVQVALDGSKNWPLNGSGLSALTVVDPGFFKNGGRRHTERTMPFGFAGNVTGGRNSLIKQLMATGLNVRVRDTGPTSYPGFAEYLCQCKVTVNFPWTGSGRHMHVKGRVLESAFAGVLLLEQRAAPTKEWFTPGVDYIEYDDAASAKKLADHYAAHPEESQPIADSLARRVRAEHGPVQFWGRVFKRIGLEAPA
jgi:hypothetical protein